MYDPLLKFRQYIFSEVGTIALEGARIQDFYSHADPGKWTSTLARINCSSKPASPKTASTTRTDISPA